MVKGRRKGTNNNKDASANEKEQKGGEKVTKKVENEVKEELFGI